MKSWKPTRLFFLISAMLGLICGCSDKGSNNNNGGGASALIEIIRDYANQLRKTDQPQCTEIQRQAAIASAVEELKTRVNKCGTVSFTGGLLEILPEGPKDHWCISISPPSEFESLISKKTCTFAGKVFVVLATKDALSINKGDPVTIQGPISYREGQAWGDGENFVDIGVQPCRNGPWGVEAHLGAPQTICVPVCDGVTCAIGPFKWLPVHSYGSAPVKSSAKGDRSQSPPSKLELPHPRISSLADIRAKAEKGDAKTQNILGVM